MLDVVVWLCLFLDETGYTIGVRLDEKPTVLPERTIDALGGFEPKKNHELQGRRGFEHRAHSDRVFVRPYSFPPFRKIYIRVITIISMVETAENRCRARSRACFRGLTMTENQ